MHFAPQLSVPTAGKIPVSSLCLIVVVDLDYLPSRSAASAAICFCSEQQLDEPRKVVRERCSAAYQQVFQEL